MFNKIALRLAFGLSVIATVITYSSESRANHPVNPNNPDQVKSGHSVFQENCVACHGVNLRGPENPKDFEGLKPPRLDSNGHASHHGDQFFFNRIKQGSRKDDGKLNEDGMPPFNEALSDQDIWAVIAYIKSTWSKEVRMKQNQKNPGHEMKTNKGGDHGGSHRGHK